MPFFDIFASPRWSPLRMRTKVVSFFIFFQELSNKKKIKALRPKMTKIASRGGGSCLNNLYHFFPPLSFSFLPHLSLSFFIFVVVSVFFSEARVLSFFLFLSFALTSSLMSCYLCPFPRASPFSLSLSLSLFLSSSPPSFSLYLYLCSFPRSCPSLITLSYFSSQLFFFSFLLLFSSVNQKFIFD